MAEPISKQEKQQRDIAAVFLVGTIVATMGAFGFGAAIMVGGLCFVGLGLSAGICFSIWNRPRLP